MRKQLLKILYIYIKLEEKDAFIENFMILRISEFISS